MFQKNVHLFWRVERKCRIVINRDKDGESDGEIPENWNGKSFGIGSRLIVGKDGKGDWVRGRYPF